MPTGVENVVRVSPEAHIGEVLSYGPKDISGVWTAKRLSDLAQYWKDGKSAGRISVLLDISRNAILGKVYRLRHKPARRRSTVASRNLVRALRKVADEVDAAWEPVMTSRKVAVVLLRLADELEASTEGEDHE